MRGGFARWYFSSLLKAWREHQIANAQSEAKIAWLDKYNAASNKFNDLAASLMKQLAESVESQRKAKFKSDFSRDIIEFSRVKKTLDALHLEDAEDKYVKKRGKETVPLLYETIRDTARVKGLALPKDE